MPETELAAPDLLIQLATDMFGKGWQPVWCLCRQSGAYTPLMGTTGGSAPWPAIEPQPAAAHRLAFRPPPDVVILDVDHYDGKRGADTIDRAEEWLGDLPPTWKVTSRGDGNPSGRYLYRKPAWLDFTDSALSQFADEHGVTSVEIVRTAHRFSWAPGDINHKNSAQVQCFDPYGEPCLLPAVAELPELPERWITYLANPPVPMAATAYTRPADGPEWWLSQADNSLGTRAELAEFAFDLLASRLTPDQALVQIRRVSVALDPSRPWHDSDFDGLVDANTQSKTMELLARQDNEHEVFRGLAGDDGIARIAERAAQAYETGQEIRAVVTPAIAYDPEVMKYLAEAPESFNIEERLRKLDGYERLLFDRLARVQADKDAKLILAGGFRGFENIADLPDPPEPSTLKITGKNSPATCVVPENTITTLTGSRASGKTWIAATWAAQELRAGNKIIWIDFERQAALLMAKFRALKVPKHLIVEQLQYAGLLPQPGQLREAVENAARYGSYRVLLVIDAFRGMQAQVAPGTSASDGDAVENIYIDYLNPAVDAGATVVILDHVRKTGDGGTFGSERKESAPDFVIKVEQVKPFTKRTPGFSSMTMTKDRYGNTEAGSAVGYLWVPGDGSESGESIRQYPDVPELRNWAPEPEVSIEDAVASSEQGNRDLILTEMVAGDRLKYSINKLAAAAMTAYPELFKAESSTKRYIRDLIKAGKLAKEDGTQGRIDLPAGLEVPVVSPEDLEHPDAR